MSSQRAKQSVEYDEERELEFYITSNLQHFVDQSHLTGYWMARKMEAVRGSEYERTYDEMLKQERPEVAEIAARGSAYVYDKIKNQIQTGSISLNRCPKCSRIVRTPFAKQCFWCGCDWHETHI